KNMGNVVAIKDNKIVTIWDFETNDIVFQPVINALSAYVKSHVVSNVFVSKFKKIGTDKNFEKLENDEVAEWQHLYLELPEMFVDKSSKSEGGIKGTYRDARNVFKRSLEEIMDYSVLTVLELISQNSLHKGAEWKGALNEFLKLKQEYDHLHTNNEKDNYTWAQSGEIGGSISKIRNHSMGTLLIDISENVDLDVAVRKWEKIVAPENFKRVKPIYTAKMRDDAIKTIEEQGYLDSLPRRFSNLDDINVNNILFSNRDSVKRIQGVGTLKELLNDVVVDPKKFSRVEEVSVDDFIQNILPSAVELEAFFENKHANNAVSLIAPVNKDSKSMFKWTNASSWAYTGNITDSSMKDNVKSAGGNVEGVLRFSIQWNDGTEYNGNDFDAYCKEPNNYVIHFGNRSLSNRTTGQLDVDIQHPKRGIPAVENITWTDRSKMLEGDYPLWVHNYSHNGGKSGFKAEIEFDGQLHSFEYDKELRQKEEVQVAIVHFSRKNGFTITEKLPSQTSSKEIWGLKTNQFIPVSVVMFSPNYWDEQKGIGHKHYFFMLKGCTNPEQPNGFYNEFLREELMQHKRAFEAIGSKMAVENVADQLSGLGFSSTKRNELLMKVKGQSERVIKIKL
ncbi:MAG: hypothetical protein JWM44_1531, partial [Bacilli bacterium]|nr:hypothetical protein [Bacilli bacterium]